MANGFPAALVPADTWHPLDRSPPPEYIPPSWTGPHVGLRLVQAMKTLRLMPAARGPQAFGNCWPAYMHEWEDLLAQQGAELDEKQKAEQAQNRTRVLPSAVEISRMESAIAWPARYLAGRPKLMRVVGVVAAGRAIDRDIASIARRRLRLAPHIARARNREGLDLIAAGLGRDRAPIF